MSDRAVLLKDNRTEREVQRLIQVRGRRGEAEGGAAAPACDAALLGRALMPSHPAPSFFKPTNRNPQIPPAPTHPPPHTTRPHT